jgi:UDP-N-acetylglucosamine acyltransferase
MAIHPLSVVDPQAEVHADATVGPFCVVKGPVRIGPHVELRNHATVYGRTTLGAGSILFPGCVVGSDPQDLKYRGEDSETIIGERVRVHECATISKGTATGGMLTSVGDDTLVMAYAHIGHDCLVERNVVIANNAQLAGHVKVGRKAIISGMTGVHHFVTIGELAFVGGMSGVRVDVPPFLMVNGNPAEPINVNVIGMERDGFPKDAIRALREVYRELYHDREEPLVEVLARLKTDAPTDPAHPVARLLAWQAEHLESNVKGRIQEAHRASPARPAV